VPSNASPLGFIAVLFALRLNNKNKHIKSMKQTKSSTRRSSASSAPAQPEAKQGGMFSRPYINFKLRTERRSLPSSAVLDLLRQHLPQAVPVAEIIGEWVWVTFAEQPADSVRAQLSQLGFHWNNVRKCWQHPCGHVTERGTVDPRAKYGSRPAAEPQPA
jgi:hypothetical protein